MKIDKNRKLKGSVLLTVVFVMAILIVFLFGTMSLSISANNRSHVNYSSAQTSVTARAVAESAIAAIANSSETGKTYAQAIASLTPEQGALKFGVQISDPNSSSLGDIYDVEVSHVGKTDFYDPITNKWETRDVLKFTANVEMAGVISTSSVYVAKYFEKDVSTDTGGGAGFVTTAGADLPTQTSVFGGSYIGLPKMGEAELYNYTGKYNARMNTRTFNKPDANNVLPSRFELMNSGGHIEADLYVNNDLFIQNWTGFVFPKEGTGITVLGDLQFDEESIGHLTYIMENKPSGELSFNKVPYIYVDGKITGTKGIVKLGNETEQDFPLNTFCASISTLDEGDNNKDNVNGFVINSNLYCMDEDLTSYIRAQNFTKLYQFADNTINMKSGKRTEVIKGELCSNGNLELKNVEINGDVRVRGNLKIEGSVVVWGDVVVEGTFDGQITEQAPVENTRAPGLYVDGNLYRSDAAADATKVDITIDNKKGYYHVYTPKINENGEYLYCNGEKINDYYFTEGKRNNNPYPDGVQVNGVPRIFHTMNDGEMPNPDADGIETDVTGFVLGTDYFYEDVSNEFVEEGDVSEYPTIIFYDEDQNPCFYAETKVVGFREADSNMEGFEIYEHGNTTYKYQKRYIYGSKTNSKTSTHKVAIGSNIQLYLDKTGEDFVYPEYATRHAIFATPNSGYGTDTKIVRTLKEVLTDVADPYKNSVLPSGIQSAYNSAGEYTSEAAVKSDMGIGVTADQLAGLGLANTVRDEYVIGNKKYYYVNKTECTQAQWDSIAGSAATVINKNCILSVEFDDDIIIDPGDSQMVVGTQGDLTFQAGKDIYVDDRGTGNVYMYIDSTGKLNFKGNIFLTANYWDLFTNLAYDETIGGAKVSFGAPQGDGYRIETTRKMKPNVHVFGASGSELNIENMDTMTMYVKSPDIKATIGGGTAKMCKSFYYNNYDVIKKNADGGCISQLLIGCFNVKEVSPSENQVVVAFIPENGSGAPVVVDQLNNYWYRPCYYSEF